METKFQTSFIPKKPILAQENIHIHSPTSLVMVIGAFLFIVSIGAAIFTFVAKAILLKTQEQSKIDLAENEKRFNLPLIEELKKANLKIDLANQLLKNHVAVSEALAIVSGLTAEKVRFSSFDFSAGSSDSSNPILNQNLGQTSGQMPGQMPAQSSGQAVLPSSKPTGTTYKIKMKGITDTFNSVAWQSDVFGRSQRYGTNKILKNPVLSDLTVDAAGNINFNFTADVVPSDISYEKSLVEALQAGN